MASIRSFKIFCVIGRRFWAGACDFLMERRSLETRKLSVGSFKPLILYTNARADRCDLMVATLSGRESRCVM